MINGPFLALFITVCEYHQAFYNYFQYLIENHDKIHRSDREAIKTSLRNIIRFHIDIKL